LIGPRCIDGFWRASIRRAGSACTMMGTCSVEANWLESQEEEGEESSRHMCSLHHMCSLLPPSPSFQHNREVDVRGTYTAISIASLLNLLTPELTAGVADYLLSCQTYEGGFGGEPGQEAHGGYVFCALAALVILGRAGEADLVSLEGWVARRQMQVEGGFQGRTNKLVDGCYSFWQGATAVLVDMVLRGEGEAEEAVGWRGPIGQAQLCSSSFLSSSSSRPSSPGPQTTSSSSSSSKGDGSPLLREVPADDAAEISYKPLAIQPSSDADDPSSLGDVPCLNQHALQKYILHCAQALDGGLRDKPGKPRDYYHTCYNLSGLSCAQWGRAGGKEGGAALVYGDVGNLLVSCKKDGREARKGGTHDTTNDHSFALLLSTPSSFLHQHTAAHDQPCL